MLDMPPSELPKEYHQEVKQKKSSALYINFSKSSLIAGIIKIPPKEERNLSYQELPLTPYDADNIEDLISTLGSKGKFELLFDEKRIRKVGDEVRYLHPFKFLGYIFSHQHLKNHMVSVFEDYFKRTNFVKDMAQTFDLYDFKDKLTIYLQDFANEVNMPVEKIKVYVDNKDWKGLLKYLIYN